MYGKYANYIEGHRYVHENHKVCSLKTQKISINKKLFYASSILFMCARNSMQNLGYENR